MQRGIKVNIDFSHSRHCRVRIDRNRGVLCSEDMFNTKLNRVIQTNLSNSSFEQIKFSKLLSFASSNQPQMHEPSSFF